MRSGDGYSNGITENAIDDDDKTNYDNESSVNRRHVLGLEVDQQKKVRCGARFLFGLHETFVNSSRRHLNRCEKHPLCLTCSPPVPCLLQRENAQERVAGQLRLQLLEQKVKVHVCTV